MAEWNYEFKRQNNYCFTDYCTGITKNNANTTQEIMDHLRLNSTQRRGNDGHIAKL